MLMARGASVDLAMAVVWDEFMLTSSPLRDAASFSGSMLEARRLSGEEERWGSSASPFIMARRDTRNGDWLLGRDVTTEPVSSIPLSLSRERSAYAEAQGDEAAEEA